MFTGSCSSYYCSALEVRACPATSGRRPHYNETASVNVSLALANGNGYKLQQPPPRAPNTDEENRKQLLLLDEIQSEVDIFIGAYLKQEFVEKEKKTELSGLHSGLLDLRQDLVSLQKQNSDWGKHLRFVEQAHGKLARDLQAATKLSKEVWGTVQMKQLEEFDLKKKLSEASERQKEFCAAYEVVKNERNKYVALIQAASQKLSELRERFKVLGNEIEILRLESAGKDKTITETKTAIGKQRAVRDAYRLELTRVLGKINSGNENVELYVLEIDKLNSLINSLERDITGLKQKFENHVQQRNATGIQLIDRNDELCILWEKSNVHELLLKKGEMAIQQKMENLRSCRIDLAALNRRMVLISFGTSERVLCVWWRFCFLLILKGACTRIGQRDR